MDKYNIEKRVETSETAINELKIKVESLNPYRNQVIEEVAREIERFTAFGQDTIDSLAIYIRGMKK